ncbi:MAG: transcription elongation factor GreA [bacterium]
MEYISQEGLDKLKKELHKRKTINRQEIAARLSEAKILGDLSENTEYSVAKENQIFNENRILELENIIKNSVLIKLGRKGQKRIQIGSVIEVKQLGNGSEKKQTFMIVGSHETDPGQGKISNESPLGKAFFGHEAGDIIEIETPSGKIKYKIICIK